MLLLAVLFLCPRQDPDLANVSCCLSKPPAGCSLHLQVVTKYLATLRTTTLNNPSSFFMAMLREAGAPAAGKLRAVCRACLTDPVLHMPLCWPTLHPRKCDCRPMGSLHAVFFHHSMRQLCRRQSS